MMYNIKSVKVGNSWDPNNQPTILVNGNLTTNYVVTYNSELNRTELWVRSRELPSYMKILIVGDTPESVEVSIEEMSM